MVKLSPNFQLLKPSLPTYRDNTHMLSQDYICNSHRVCALASGWNTCNRASGRRCLCLWILEGLMAWFVGWEGAPGGHLGGTWARVGWSRREAPHCLSVPHNSLLGYCSSRLFEHNIHNLQGLANVSHMRQIKTCFCDTHDQTGLVDCRSKGIIFLLC